MAAANMKEAKMDHHFNSHGADVSIQKAFNTGPNHSHAIIGVLAESEKGEAFLTAYFKETAFADEPDDDDVIIGSGSLLPDELDQSSGWPAAAGVKLDNQTRGE